MKTKMITISFIWFFLIRILYAQNSENNDWNWQYPKPQGNTLRDIFTFDENTAIAVGDLGTVIKTTDGGTSWDVQHHAGGSSNDLYGAHFVNNLYGWAVGGEVVLKTEDGGENWSVLYEDSSYNFRCVYFANPDTGWVFGKGIIMKTIDGGENWSKYFIYDYDDIPTFKEAQFIDDKTGYVVGYGFYGNTIYKTIDGGNQWFKIDNIEPRIYNLHDIHFINKETGWVLGGYGEIIKTVDGGESWGHINLSDKYGKEEYQYLYSISFTDSLNGIISGNGYILVTIDGGENWEEMSPDQITEEALLKIRFYDKNIGWMIGGYGVIYRTIDSGENWVAQRESKYVFNSIYFVDENVGWAVGEKGIILHTEDGGTNWFKQNQNDSLVLNSVYAIDKQNAFAVGGLVEGSSIFDRTGIILKTSNGGENWTRESYDSLLGFNSIVFTNDSVGWISGINGTLLKTTNNGKNWEKIKLDNSFETVPLGKIQFIDNTGWISYLWGNSLLKTFDNGETWFIQVFETNLEISSVFFIDDKLGWAVGNYNGENNILKTLDGGDNWDILTITPPSYDFSMQFINENTGWITGYNYLNQKILIIKTNDGGNTWTELKNPLPNYGSHIYFIDENTGWTVGEGIIKTSNGGGVVSVNDEKKINQSISQQFTLFQNYPNPFNPSTIINYQLLKSSYVTLKIYDILGREIIALVNQEQSPGHYKIEFDSGRYKLSSGVYFYRMQAGKYKETKKMILVR